MTHGVGANLRAYESEVFCGAVITAFSTLASPPLGAALGVYFVTDITTNLIADHFRLGQSGPLAKVIRVALITLVGLGAAFGTFCAITGTVALTTGTIGLGVSIVCLSILASMVS